MSPNQRQSEYRDDDPTSVQVTWATLDEIHDRKGRGESCEDVIRRCLGLDD